MAPLDDSQPFATSPNEFQGCFRHLACMHTVGEQPHDLNPKLWAHSLTNYKNQNGYKIYADALPEWLRIMLDVVPKCARSGSDSVSELIPKEFPKCFRSVSEVFPKVFPKCFRSVSEVFPTCFRNISKMFQACLQTLFDVMFLLVCSDMCPKCVRIVTEIAPTCFMCLLSPR